MPPSQPLKLNACQCGRIHFTYRSMTLHFEKKNFWPMPGKWVEWPLTYQKPPGCKSHEASLTPKRQIAIERKTRLIDMVRSRKAYSATIHQVAGIKGILKR